MELRDLPPTCNDLIEVIEIICVTEKLSDSNFSYGITEWDHKWEIIFNIPICTIIIPKNISKMTPCYTHIMNRMTVQIAEEMHKELSVNPGIFSNRGMINGVPHSWTIHFKNQKAIYDYYVIGKKYKIF